MREEPAVRPSVTDTVNGTSSATWNTVKLCLRKFTPAWVSKLTWPGNSQTSYKDLLSPLSGVEDLGLGHGQ